MKVGFVCGVFDLFHAGHVRMLAECKAHCDYLIVALNVAEDLPKGKNVPIFSISERIEIMEACKFADKVVYYKSELELSDCLREVKPDVRFLGEDYKGKEITGIEFSNEIYYTNRQHGLSTSSYINEIVNRYK
jgi:glycerol-3-phosphate cytidylyltransferase